MLCGSRGIQNNQCSVCGGEGCLSRCANSSIECSSSIHGQLNSIIEMVELTEKELSIKQNASNVIYARQYEIEKNVTHIFTGLKREQETIFLLDIILNDIIGSIDRTQAVMTNLTDVLRDRKPADIREIIENIFNMKISLTKEHLEENIRDIRGLVEQAQRSSQAADEEEKIRDATVKLNRARSIENDLLTYVR